ncbi:MAG: Asp-tRNA(Asn)/Glu-tRNA(Gln) amidotransferase subunit GatB [Polyangiaceae bacterium]|nr:Asp-tRNA(Asn)/Glu-tRNA(Gln) amidotransferase subunit GatB [Polyangiaceae bacterium]
MPERWEAVIGLEVHAQLLTETKLFCACATRFGEEPNRNVCPVCLGLPGALPVLNRHAVELAVRAARAVGCALHDLSVFARKNYFYPDLPKGYQISQYERPLATGGHLEFEGEGGRKRAGITRIHMEEDAGKNVHGVGGDSLVDLNRAGTPLIEIVGEPDLRSGAEAAAYLRALRDVLVFLGVNDGNLEEGSFRCDANVSVRQVGDAKLGTRAEIKNVNSFRFVQRAIELEVARQVAILESGGRVVQETRGFDHDAGRTYSLRSKEEAHDYRYFPDPDLPPLVLDPALKGGELPELPAAKRARYQALGLTPQAAQVLTGHPGIARFFERTLALGASPVSAANLIQTEVLRDAKLHGLDAELGVTPEQVAELLRLTEAGTISGKQAKEVFVAVAGTSRMPSAVVEERGLRVVSDEGQLLPLCQKLVAENPKQVEQVRAGKKSMLGFFVGQVMKQTGGAADPKLVSALLERLIAEEKT